MQNPRKEKEKELIDEKLAKYERLATAAGVEIDDILKKLGD